VRDYYLTIKYILPHVSQNNGISVEPLFASLPTFTHPTFFALEELHVIGQGIAKHVYELVTVSMNKSYNKAVALKYKPTEEDLIEKGISSAANWPYSFDIPKHKLTEIGVLVELSRSTVPSTFSSKWENPIQQSGGNRGVDWIDFLLYMVPTVFIPALTNNNAKKPLLSLTKACATALKWRVTHDDLEMMKE